MYDLWTIPDNKPVDCDCFIVLSYGVKSRFTPTKPTRELIKLAKKWQKKFPQSKIIMSTGDNQLLGKTNATIMAEYGKKIGIPKNSIIEEGLSMDTYENLTFSKKLMDIHKLKKPTIVAYDFHTKRAVAIANKLGWSGYSWLSAKSPGEGAYGHKYLQTISRLSIFIYEILAWFYNKKKGQI